MSNKSFRSKTMGTRLPLFAVLTATCFVGWSSPAYANALLNGDFEDTWTTGSVAPNWSANNSGGSWSFAHETSIVHGGINAQRLNRPSTSNTGNWGALYQSVTANVGDAFTLADAWVYCVANSSLVADTVRVAWDGLVPSGLGNLPIWATAAQSANTWYEFTSLPGGNATGTTVTFAFVNRLASSTASAMDTIWDDLLIYQAYVPPAPSVFDPTETTLTIDVNPGGNSGNSSAEFAISLGSDWVQADGTVGASQVWQTDAAWGSKVVTGLDSGTTYNFEVLARYDGTYTQATLPEGNIGSLSTVPEPTTLTLLVLGLGGVVAMLRRRV
jgi:hypothetical protein